MKLEPVCASEHVCNEDQIGCYLVFPADKISAWAKELIEPLDKIHGNYWACMCELPPEGTGYCALQKHIIELRELSGCHSLESQMPPAFDFAFASHLPGGKCKDRAGGLRKGEKE